MDVVAEGLLRMTIERPGLVTSRCRRAKRWTTSRVTRNGGTPSRSRAGTPSRAAGSTAWSVYVRAFTSDPAGAIRARG
jgi:hypothetical protein